MEKLRKLGCVRDLKGKMTEIVNGQNYMKIHHIRSKPTKNFITMK